MVQRHPAAASLKACVLRAATEKEGPTTLQVTARLFRYARAYTSNEIRDTRLHVRESRADRKRQSNGYFVSIPTASSYESSLFFFSFRYRINDQQLTDRQSLELVHRTEKVSEISRL